MAELFGFKFERIKDTKGSEKFTAPSLDDGTVDVAGGGFYGQILDVEGRERTENDLIRRYRDISQQPECDSAIEDIVNEGIVSDERDQSVEIVLDRLPQPKRIKDKIKEEFDNVMRLLDFNVKGHDIFRRWYVDGRLFYHKVIDKNNPRRGIVDLRYIEPRKIRKVREMQKGTKSGSSVDIVKKIEEYYIYNDKGLVVQSGTSQGIKISADSITYCPSGLVDQNKGHVLSYLHKAIKPVNQLRMIEDALVIYRISRAPERRIFYIDVGNLPRGKSEQYLKDIMARYRNKLVYDANTGELKDDRKHMSMLEDFWLPRREGGRGTEISTLPGGENLGQIDDIIYFQKRLYRALNVPISRLEQESQFSLGRATEISRDELKFHKFIERLRRKFSGLFIEILKKQLMLKGIITELDWNEWKGDITVDYVRDNHFTELRDSEILRERIASLDAVANYIGPEGFFSKEWVWKNILQLSQEEVEDMKKQIEDEANAGEEMAEPEPEEEPIDDEPQDDEGEAEPEDT